MNINFTALTDAVARDRASSIEWVRKRNAHIDQLPKHEIDRARRALMEQYRGVYVRRDLVHDTSGRFLQERWYVEFGSDYRNAIKLSDAYLLDENPDQIANLILDNWDEKFDSFVERRYSGFAPMN